jgi:hypothetical protein
MLFGWRNPAFAALLFLQEKGAAMALSTKPPAFDRANVEGTVKNLCDYLIRLQEELDFTLEQMQKLLQSMNK